MLNEAEPFARVPVPSTVAPSRNCTVPVAVDGLTVAVKVTVAPENAGFCADVIEVTVDAGALTDCVIAGSCEVR